MVIWQLSDGKAGHISQATGLVNALLERVVAEAHLLEAPSLPACMYSLCTKSCAWAEALPAPHVVIGAGHATHLPMLAARRTFRARAIVLMRPSLPLSWFDHCLIPAHDNPPTAKNITITNGAINTMRYGDKHECERGLILIGGGSRHYRFDTVQMIAHIKTLLSGAPGQHWTLSTSPRTPAGFVDHLGELESAGVDVVLWRHCDGGWLAEALSRASRVWVSEDSMSMMYEALTSGCCVGLLPVSRKGRSRIHRAVDTLIEDRLVTTLADWLNNRRMPAPALRLDEANRCAHILLEKGLIHHGHL